MKKDDSQLLISIKHFKKLKRLLRYLTKLFL